MDAYWDGVDQARSHPRQPEGSCATNTVSAWEYIPRRMYSDAMFNIRSASSAR